MKLIKSKLPQKVSFQDSEEFEQLHVEFTHVNPFNKSQLQELFILQVALYCPGECKQIPNFEHHVDAL